MYRKRWSLSGKRMGVAGQGEVGFRPGLHKMRKTFAFPF